jgi:hypothetical protein
MSLAVPRATSWFRVAEHAYRVLEPTGELREAAGCGATGMISAAVETVAAFASVCVKIFAATESVISDFVGVLK